MSAQALPIDDTASWDYAQVWDKFPVPARPSEEELVLLEREIAQKPHKKMLILGSTIEYRSIAKRLGISPYIADFEKSHYDILTQYANERFEGEHFLEIDWLDVEDVDMYDVIVGHRPFNVIGREVVQKFFDRMYSSLKPGGVFYCKGNIKKEGDTDRLDQLVDEWAFKEERKYPLFSYIEVELYFHCADEYGYVKYPMAREVVDGWMNSGRISQEDFNLIKLLVSMSEEARFRGAIYEDEIRAAVQNAGFKEQEWIVLDKDICQNMPILKLVK